MPNCVCINLNPKLFFFDIIMEFQYFTHDACHIIVSYTYHNLYKTTTIDNSLTKMSKTNSFSYVWHIAWDQSRAMSELLPS